MLHDYWRYRGDPAFLQPLLGTADGIMRWYERHLRADGLFDPVGWWSFTDWSAGWENGEPPGTYTGGSSVLALQFFCNADHAADLFEAFGEIERASHWRAVADRVRKAVAAKCYDPARGLIADTTEKQSFSQHANILAVLTETLPAIQWQPVMAKVTDDPSLTQTTFYFLFYPHRALRKAGMADRYLSLLQPWHNMIAPGITTFAEKPEPTRSDCHAWSACPNYDFLDLICGIGPAEPGFRSMHIESSLGNLTWASATLPHPQGLIEVRFERRGENGVMAAITLPVGLHGEFAWSGKKVALKPGSQNIEL
ncbi:MAG: hypothetical protein EHM17_02565 [Verrucomicrobiaceae bacterium]|nr:MAG: hypothetical protein EHM17_02565 [Verrucomicrobiaceae bacterium]